MGGWEEGGLGIYFPVPPASRLQGFGCCTTKGHSSFQMPSPYSHSVWILQTNCTSGLGVAKQSKHPCIQFSSVQFSRSVVSDSLRPHELQHARPPCPSPTSGVHPDSRPSSQWCHPAISSSVVPFSSCRQSLPGSGSFPMSQLFPWGGQSTGVSALASFLPKKSQGWSPSEWTVLNTPKVTGLSVPSVLTCVGPQW